MAEIVSAESLVAAQHAYELTRKQVLAALRYAAHLAAQPPRSGAASG